MSGCTHVFCKTCIVNSVMHGNMNCPYCRTNVGMEVISKAFEIRIGKNVSLMFEFEVDVSMQPWKWLKHTWTKKMSKQFYTIHSKDTDVEQWKSTIRSKYYDENGLII
jgi:hypothetical protein